MAGAVFLSIGDFARAQSCTVTPRFAGVLVPDASLRTLSTQNPGGSPARFDVQATTGGLIPGLLCSLLLPRDCPRLRSNGEPSVVHLPSGTSFSNQIEVSAEIEGRSAFLDLIGLVVLFGRHQVRMDMTVSLPAGQRLQSGTYEGIQPVRCG